MNALKQAVVRHPNDRDILAALVAFARDAGDIAGALGYAEQLARIAPHDQQLARVIGDLRSRLTNLPAR
jgi:Flp pilus assembly protein TadD